MKAIKRSWRTFTGILGVTAAIAIAGWTVFADVPQPVLRVASLGSNQFLITITNGANTNYTLLWTPALNDPDNPWEVLGIGVAGETNFAVDVGTVPIGFFKMLVGDDTDGDGVPEWEDAQPGNPAVGILSLTIDSPLNGSVLN